MAETEFEVIRRDGQVHIMMFDEDDDLEVVSLDLESAEILGTAILVKAYQHEEDDASE